MSGVSITTEPSTQFFINDVDVEKAAFFETLGVGDFVRAYWHSISSIGESPDELAIIRQ
jgi:hypothetical protein